MNSNRHLNPEKAEKYREFRESVEKLPEPIERLPNLTKLPMIEPPMKDWIDGRYLTPEEAEKYRKVREDVAKELPELIERHYARKEVKEKDFENG